VATVRSSLPLDYRLYLPREWTDDRARCGKAGVPEEIEFLSKGEIARAQIAAAMAAGVARGIVLGDADYGNEAAFRDWLGEQALLYVLGVRANTAVWWGPISPRRPARGRACQARRPLQAGDGARRGAGLAAAELAHGELA
jgi:SRSO17 transposase